MKPVCSAEPSNESVDALRASDLEVESPPDRVICYDGRVTLVVDMLGVVKQGDSCSVGGTV